MNPKKYGWKYWQDKDEQRQQVDDIAFSILFFGTCAVWGTIVGQIAYLFTR